MPNSNSRLIIFAKAPKAGYSKTRLIPALGSDGAAQLHQQLVNHTLSNLNNNPFCAIELWCAPDTEHPFFEHCAQQFNITLHQQKGNDLGHRMSHAMRDVLTRTDSAIIIGTDCPTLTQEDLSETVTALKKHDAVIGPAVDGGYYLLGLNQHQGDLFTNINWGSDQVLKQTLQQSQQLKLNHHLLREQQDIDTPADLINLPVLASL